MIKKYRCATWLGICVLASFAQNAFAQNNQDIAGGNAPHKPLFIPVMYDHKDAWNTQAYDFSQSLPNIPLSTSPADSISTGEIAPTKPHNNFKPEKQKDHTNKVEKALKKIPHSDKLKYTWDVIDGDVDLYFEDLRLDKGNRGVSYKTNTIPYMGKMDGMQIKAEIGEDSKLTFQRVMLCLLATFPHHAIAYDDNFQRSEEPVLETDDKGFAYHFIGNAEDEGAFKLFLKNTTSDHELIDPTADKMNAIQPAAGIKLQFEF